jgi:DNA-binding CsgD family transcriptional regulator
MHQNNRSTRQIFAAERRQQIIALRRKHYTFEEIGREIGISAKSVWVHYQKALALYPASDIDELRIEGNDLADTCIRKALETYERTHERQPRTAMEALKVACMWAERKAKNNGSDMPTRIDLTQQPVDSIDAAIAKLQAELGQAPKQIQAAIESPVAPPAAAIEAAGEKSRRLEIPGYDDDDADLESEPAPLKTSRWLSEAAVPSETRAPQDVDDGADAENYAAAYQQQPQPQRQPEQQVVEDIPGWRRSVRVTRWD